MRPFRTAAGMKAVNVSTNCWGSLSGGEYGLAVGIGVWLTVASMLPGTRYASTKPLESRPQS